MAENTLSQDDLIERIARVPPISTWTLTYGDGTTGSHRLRTVLAAFLDRYFHAWQIVQAEHIMVTNRCSAALEHIFWALWDEQDCFLVSLPFFREFIPKAEFRVRCNLIEVGCGGLDPFEPESSKSTKGQFCEHARPATASETSSSAARTTL